MITRRLLPLLFGMLIGSISVWSFAADLPLDFSASAPTGVTVSGNRAISVPSGSWAANATVSGSAVSVGRSVGLTIDGVATVVSSRRSIPFSALARSTASLARSASAPAIAGWLFVSGLHYINDNWVKSDPNYSVQSGCIDLTAACQLQIGKTVASCYSPGVQWLEYHRGYAPPSGWSSSLDYGFTYCASGTQAYRRRLVASGGATPQGDMFPASESDIESAVSTALNNGTLNPITTLDGIEDAGGTASLISDISVPTVTGPASVDGQTTTGVISGPAGQTQTTVQTKYPITYAPGAVSIGRQETRSVTTPDGNTTTETNTTNPASGQAPKQEEKPLCELFPDASGCEKLGNPAEDITLQTRDLDISSLNYQSVSGSCPGPKTIATSHGSYELSYEPVCTAADFLRPVIVLSGLLTAGIFVFMGARRAS